MARARASTPPADSSAVEQKYLEAGQVPPNGGRGRGKIKLAPLPEAAARAVTFDFGGDVVSDTDLRVFLPGCPLAQARDARAAAAPDRRFHVLGAVEAVNGADSRCSGATPASEVGIFTPERASVVTSCPSSSRSSRSRGSSRATVEPVADIQAKFSKYNLTAFTVGVHNVNIANSADIIPETSDPGIQEALTTVAEEAGSLQQILEAADSNDAIDWEYVAESVSHWLDTVASLIATAGDEDRILLERYDERLQRLLDPKRHGNRPQTKKLSEFVESWDLSGEMMMLVGSADVILTLPGGFTAYVETLLTNLQRHAPGAKLIVRFEDGNLSLLDNGHGMPPDAFADKMQDAQNRGAAAAAQGAASATVAAPQGGLGLTSGFMLIDGSELRLNVVTCQPDGSLAVFDGSETSTPTDRPAFVPEAFTQGFGVVLSNLEEHKMYVKQPAPPLDDEGRFDERQLRIFISDDMTPKWRLAKRILQKEFPGATIVTENSLPGVKERLLAEEGFHVLVMDNKMNEGDAYPVLFSHGRALYGPQAPVYYSLAGTTEGFLDIFPTKEAMVISKNMYAALAVQIRRKWDPDYVEVVASPAGGMGAATTAPATGAALRSPPRVRREPTSPDAAATGMDVGALFGSPAQGPPSRPPRVRSSSASSNEEGEVPVATPVAVRPARSGSATSTIASGDGDGGAGNGGDGVTAGATGEPGPAPQLPRTSSNHSQVHPAGSLAPTAFTPAAAPPPAVVPKDPTGDGNPGCCRCM